MYLLVALFFSLIINGTGLHQHEISGYVYDASSGEYLPSATVLIEDTYRGTITNNEGFFSLSADSLPVTIQVRFIGYETKRVPIEPGSQFPLQIALEPAVAELDEIEVTGEDPGLSIMELVIERKKIWRESLKTYSADAYTRQALRNDTSIVSITESSSIAFWHYEMGSREVQLSRRQTSNIAEDQNFVGVRFLPNFYDDNIEIAGYNLVGITHPNALRYYRFSLLETSRMDGKPLYKIEVIPRRSRQPLFEGTVWILGRDYAMIEVDLKPNDVVNFPPPVQDFNLSYKQQFSNYGGEYWLPVDMRIEGLIRISMVGLRFPPIQFSQVSRLSDYQINIELPDSVYQDNQILTRAEDIDQSAEMVQVNPIPLTDEERLAYETMDSTKTLEEAFRPEGFLARMAEASEERDGRLGGFMPEGMSPRFRYNRHDGYHLGLGYQRSDFDGRLRLQTRAGYNFNTRLWDYGGKINLLMMRAGTARLHLFGGYENGTATRYSSEFYSMGLNSIPLLLGGIDYFDYYRNEELFAGIELLGFLPRMSLRAKAARELHTNTEELKIHNHSWFGWHDDRRDNPAIDEGALHSVSAEVAYNKSSNDFGITGKRQVVAGIEHSSPSLGSDFDFTRLTLRADWNINTFYQRRLFANTLDLHLSAGTTIGNPPLQRYGTVDGSLNLFTPFGTLKTRRNLPYEGTTWWVAIAEHNFRTIPFELLGLRPLADRGWGIILFGGAGYTEVSGNDSEFLMTTPGIHSEVGGSLNSIFGILRFDVAFRLDSPGTYIGFSVPRYF